MRYAVVLIAGAIVSAYIIHRGQPRCPQCNDRYCIVYMAGLER